jgi:hypothetical protein
MGSTLRRVFTFANVVAILALMVSLSGGVYAAAKINGKDIENQSIAGKKLKNDTLTGKQIKESALEGLASTGDLKGLASKGDTRRIRSQNTVTGGGIVTTQVLALGRLRVEIECGGGSGKLRASTTASSGSWDRASTFESTNVAPTADVSGGILTSTPSTVLNVFPVSVGQFSREVGSIVFNIDAAKETILMDFAFYLSRDASSQTCYLAGTAQRVSG